MRLLATTVCLLLLCVISLRPLSAWPQYTTVDLSPLPGHTASEARAINWFGQVAGWSSGSGRWTPVVWDRDGHATPLPRSAKYQSGLAYDINNYGEVVGVLRDVAHNDYAVLWRPDGAVIELGTLPGHISSSAAAINDAGQVAGYSVDLNHYRHAFIWDVSGGMRPLYSLPDEVWSHARCVNNSGQAGGMYVSETWYPFGVLWHDEDSAEVLSMPDRDHGSQVLALNDLGQAVGLLHSRGFPSSGHPVIWTGGTLQRLPCCDAVGGSANAINNVGQVVGDLAFPSLEIPSNPPFFRYDCPVLWSASPSGYTGYLLNANGTAYGINDAGEIVGNRNLLPDKQPLPPWQASLWRGVLWQPVARTVIIDVKPGEYPNNVNLRSNGVVPVAVLCTPEFDPATVNPDTVVFAGARPIRWSLTDVDTDGAADLLLFFRTQDLYLLALSEEAVLAGRMVNDGYVRGVDRVRIVRTGK